MKTEGKLYFKLVAENGEIGAMELETDKAEKVLATVRKVYPTIEPMKKKAFRKLVKILEAS